jgi:hypothetical protein
MRCPAGSTFAIGLRLMPEPDEPRDTTIQRVIDLAFRGDRSRYAAFLRELRKVIPDDASVILRGSAVMGTRWADGAAFDADGPGSSDLDVTFVGGGLINRWDEFYIPGLHTVPLSDEHPNACPEFNALRATLCRIAGRPVNLQATTGLVQFARDVTMDQPWVELIENQQKARDEAAKESDGDAVAKAG